jgi:hypothetical protein
VGKGNKRRGAEPLSPGHGLQSPGQNGGGNGKGIVIYAEFGLSSCHDAKEDRPTKGRIMARKVEVKLLDDIDGTTADETVRFAVDGTNYEIDLSTKHADQLRSSLAQYITNGRRIGRGHLVPTGGRSRGAAATPARVDRAQNQAIREWAKRKGIELNGRGRIPRDVLAQYEAEAGR